MDFYDQFPPGSVLPAPTVTAPKVVLCVDCVYEEKGRCRRRAPQVHVDAKGDTWTVWPTVGVYPLDGCGEGAEK